jgi:putative FmdB family regulatory protein
MSTVVPLAGTGPGRQHVTSGAMALYEYVCRDCDTSFELRRAMGAADSGVTCPSGHTDVRRKLSVFASVGVTWDAGTDRSSPVSSGGGCCGGSCGCGR